MRFQLISIVVLTSLVLSVNGQEWIRIYGDSINTVTYHVHEHYDKGYFFSGDQSKGWTSYGWLMKTDINGYKLWTKSYGQPGKFNPISSLRTTSDGGVIAIGGSDNISANCNDPILYKINSCGEKEWCKLYNAPGCNAWGVDIETVSNGDYMAIFDRWKSGTEQTIWLFRLDSVGEVIWAQVYATDPAFWSELSYSLLQTTDSCFLITGQAYYPDSMYPTKKIIKIILIKVNLDGEAVFEVPWGTNNGIYSDGRLSTIDSENNIYTAGRRARTTAPGGDSPCLFKTSATGQPVFYKDMKTTSSLGIATTINWFQDSTMVLCASWESVGYDTSALIKTDSLGNFIKEKPLFTNYGTGSFWASDITYNNKLILGGYLYSSGVFNSCAFKLTSDLEYDSVYTTPFTYDSLCPYPIVSDTIPLDDCQVVVVGTEEAQQHPETTRLRVFPNPANDRIAVEMPKYMVRKTAGNGVTATTIYHQWKEVRLEVFDLYGRLMFCQTVPQQQKSVTLEVAAWNAGMYVARVVFMNEVAAREKFVVE